MTKFYFAFLLCVFTGFRVVSQELPVGAEYFLIANLSGQEDTSATGGIALAPAEMSQLVNIYATTPFGLKSVTVDFSTDKLRWHLQQSCRVAYPNPGEPTLGVCALKLSEQHTRFLQDNKTVYVRLSFFNPKGLLCEELIQKGIVVQDMHSARAYKLDKGLQTRLAKLKTQTGLLVVK